MDACPRCGASIEATTKFCPECGTQVRVQPVQGEVIERRSLARGPARPNPWTAAMLSIVPGLGHWYAGAPRRGFVFFVAIVAGEVLGIDLDLTVIGDVVGIPLGAGATGLWVYCAVDAYRTALRHRAESA